MAGTNRRKKVDGKPAQPREGAEFLSDIVGKNIAVFRAIAELTQEDLAGRMKLLGHPWYGTTVGQVEKGVRLVTVEEVLGLALALGVTVYYLLSPLPRADGGPALIDLGPDSAIPTLPREDVDRVYDERGMLLPPPPLIVWEGNHPIAPLPATSDPRLRTVSYRERMNGHSRLFRVRALARREDVPRAGEEVLLLGGRIEILSVRVGMSPGSSAWVYATILGRVLEGQAEEEVAL